MKYKNTDWEAWAEEFGPRDRFDLEVLIKVADGAAFALPYRGKAASNGNAWMISRDGDRELRLNTGSARSGFRQYLWYYESGKIDWKKKPHTLEDFFE